MVSKCLGGNVSTELASEELSNDLCTLLVHFVDAGTTVDLSDPVQLLVMFNNRHSGLLVNTFEGYKLFEGACTGKIITHGIAS